MPCAEIRHHMRTIIYMDVNPIRPRCRFRRICYSFHKPYCGFKRFELRCQLERLPFLSCIRACSSHCRERHQCNRRRGSLQKCTTINTRFSHFRTHYNLLTESRHASSFSKTLVPTRWSLFHDIRQRLRVFNIPAPECAGPYTIKIYIEFLPYNSSYHVHAGAIGPRKRPAIGK